MIANSARLGVTSRVRPAEGLQRNWAISATTHFPLPVIVDHMFRDPESGALGWWIQATIDLVNGTPALVDMHLTVPGGADIARLQREFRWASPLDIVMLTVPQLLERGLDPFDYDFPVGDFPKSADLTEPGTARLDDEFLESIVREYLACGRGYAKTMARHYSVSPRTVVSWIEKARRRGILSPVRQGAHGGEIVPRAQRGTTRAPNSGS